MPNRFTTDELANLLLLLRSSQPENVELAFSLLAEGPQPPQLLAALFYVYQFAPTASIAEAAERLLRANPRLAASGVMDFYWQQISRSLLLSSQEKTLAQQLHLCQAEADLPAKLLAEWLYEDHKLGAYYLLDGGRKADADLSFCQKGDLIDLSQAGLEEFPLAVLAHKNLRHLRLNDNFLRRLPPEIAELEQLEVLELSGNQLRKLPKALLSLKQLKRLELGRNNLKQFPSFLAELPQLEALELTGSCQVNLQRGLALPEEFCRAPKLRQLGLANYKRPSQSLKAYTPFHNYPHFSELQLPAGQRLPLEQPLAMAALAFEQNKEGLAFLLRYSEDSEQKRRLLAHFYQEEAKTMDLSGQYLEHLPAEIADFDIEILDLSQCRLGLVGSYYKQKEELSKGAKQVDRERLHILGQLKNMRALSLKNCSLTALPASLFDLPNLEDLDLSYNLLEEFPENWRGLPNLQRLSFYQSFSVYSPSLELPSSFLQLKQLRELRFYLHRAAKEGVKEQIKAHFGPELQYLLD
ncbi:leucine-rich repeat domain-containing protein [Saprospira grandis]|uniref:leucine-rich repeat domain-containing protein n=1 Tax=Saprospira grandis TaxID=1008 RepID=UPI0022DE104E|nr:leucine-rich repeat domain-containing protein [Saprospira grandis]WBM73836.1 leucine-rich repeat domain-containing protein [Saprospira grandis]